MKRVKTLKGEQLMLFVNGSVIPLSTSCKLTMNMTIDSDATKDDGTEDHSVAGVRSWQVTNDSYLVSSSVEDLREGDVVTILVGQPANWNFDGIEAVSGGWSAPTTDYYSGTGIVESIDITADNGSVAAGSVNIKGEGQLQHLGITNVEIAFNGVGNEVDILDANDNVRACFVGTKAGVNIFTTAVVKGSLLRAEAIPAAGNTFQSWTVVTDEEEGYPTSTLIEVSTTGCNNAEITADFIMEGGGAVEGI